MKCTSVCKVFLISALLVSATFIGSLQKTNHDIARDSVLLEDFLAPSIFFRESTFAITQGQIVNDGTLTLWEKREILALSVYALHARVNPIFSLNGTDLEDFLQSVELLSDSQDQIAHTYQGRDKKIIESSLHPIEYLRSLARTEEFRKVLTLKPTAENARRYHSSLLSTVEARAEYITTLKESLETIRTEPFREGRITFTNGTITIDDMLTSLEELTEEASIQAKKERARWRCYQFGVSCKKPKYPSATLIQEEASPPTTMPAHIARNTDILLRFRETLPYGTFPQHSTAILETSSCYGTDEPIVYVLWRKQTDTKPFLRVDLANDLVLTDTHEQRALRNYFDAIQFEGARYIYQPLSNYYMCLDLAHDTSALVSMLFVIETLQERPLFSINSNVSDPKEMSDALTQKLAQLKRIETTLLGEKALQQTQVEAYVKLLFDILNMHSQELSLHYSFEEILRAESTAIAYAHKSAHYDELLLHALDNNRFLEVFKATNAVLDIERMMYTRAFPHLLLGAANSSISQKRILFADTSKETSLKGFDSYNTELSKEYDPNAMIQLIQETLRIETELRN